MAERTKHKYMEDHEYLIARKLIDTAIAAGWTISVWADGEEEMIANSTDPEKLLAEMCQTGSYDILSFYDAAQHQGNVMLVYGNEPGVLISDYHVKLEEFLKPVNAYAETLEE